MFEGTFLHWRYPLHSNVCEVMLYKLNLSRSHLQQRQQPRYLDSSCNQKDIRMSSIFLPVSLIGLSLSLFSAAVFIRQRQRTSFRTSLIALSATISCYMLFSSLDFINVLSGACLYWREPRRHAQVFLGAIICLFVDTMICLRNWCNVLMTAQRTEALLFPLRVRKLLKKRNFCLCLLLLLLICLPLSLVRSIAEVFVVCADDSTGEVYGIVGYPLSEEEDKNNPHLEGRKRHFHFLLNEESWFNHYETYAFFTVQTVAPVLLVIAFSLTMSVAMLRRCSSGSAQHPQAVAASTIAGNRQSKRNKIRASRTVLCLAAIFTALQMPNFLFPLVLTGTSMPEESAAGKIFQFVAELCLLLDSILNIFVYAYFVPDLRLCCARIWCRLAGGAGGTHEQASTRRRDDHRGTSAATSEVRSPLQICRSAEGTSTVAAAALDDEEEE